MHSGDTLAEGGARSLGRRWRALPVNATNWDDHQPIQVCFERNTIVQLGAQAKLKGLVPLATERQQQVGKKAELMRPASGVTRQITAEQAVGRRWAGGGQATAGRDTRWVTTGQGRQAAGGRHVDDGKRDAGIVMAAKRRDVVASQIGEHVPVFGVLAPEITSIT
ncbi:hypothetical protein GGX14DRAFT_389312 [Mycena pura]|uniref:Uncharacterized protein n=1 Tax=Mycena pura TaxID=153505 RepID=A0AAD6VS30_9AGAR|nr:hypothetical protein GGX14DRAFT_389312 [Mycena pura]